MHDIPRSLPFLKTPSLLLCMIFSATILAPGAVAQITPPDASAPDRPAGALDDDFRRKEAPPEYADDPNSPWTRARLAMQFAREGRPDLALEHLLWCYDRGAVEYPDYILALNGPLPTQLAILGQTYPPALQAMKERSEALRRKLAVNPARAKADTAAQVAALDVALLDKPAILSTLKMLPKGRAAQAYGETVRPLLISNQHYREAVDIGSMEAEFGRRRAEMQTRLDELREFTRTDLAKIAPAMRTSTAMLGVLYVEALAGVNENARAQKLIRDLLKVQDTPEVREALDQALRRAGAAALADSLAAGKK